MSDTITGTATVHKVLSPRQTVYKLCPPYKGWSGEENHVFVVASQASGGYRSEVLVFPSDGEGITSFSEIGGSYAEDQGHVSALKDMGYRLGGDPEAIMDTIRRSGRNIPKAENGLGEHSEVWGY